MISYEDSKNKVNSHKVVLLKSCIRILQLHFQQIQLVLPALLDGSVVCFVDSDSVIRIGGVGLQSPVGVFICSSSQVTKLVTRLMMKLNC
jgi:hypothetical protein